MAKYYDVIMRAPHVCDIITAQPKTYDITATDRVWEANITTYFLPARIFISVVNRIILNAIASSDATTVSKYLHAASTLILGASMSARVQKYISGASDIIDLGVLAKVLNHITVDGFDDIFTIASAASFVATTYRHLFEMDEHTLSEYSEMTLEDVYFISMED